MDAALLFIVILLVVIFAVDAANAGGGNTSEVATPRDDGPDASSGQSRCGYGLDDRSHALPSAVASSGIGAESSGLNFAGKCAEPFRVNEKHLGGEVGMMTTHGQAPDQSKVSPEMKDAAWSDSHMSAMATAVSSTHGGARHIRMIG